MKRGIRNNNPLNIRHSSDKWLGAAMIQTDRSFVQFQSMAYGYRAAWKVLDTYCLRFTREREVFNVRNIIFRWAPPTENDTDNYIRTVLRLTGLGGNENMTQPSRGTNYERWELLIRAMTTMECGTPYKEVDVEAIREGFDFAFPGVRKVKKRIEPTEPADFGVSRLPDIRGTTFAYGEEYAYW